MKNFSSWNRRDFIFKPLGCLAASRLLSGIPLFAQSSSPAPSPDTKPLIYRTLGKTGISMPIVSMGVMNADVPGLIRRSYELGIRHFDTAAVYQDGRNEEMVGRVIKEMGIRNKVTIATKGFVPVLNKGMNAAQSKARFAEIFDGSLKRLQMDHVDILFYHSVDTVEDANAEGPIAALVEAKKAGKARFIGISTHRPDAILNEAMKLGVYDVALVVMNYTMAGAPEILNTIDRAAKQGIGIIAMKTQAGGSVKPDPKLPKQLSPASQTALLKWVLRHESVATAIPGFSTYEHLEQDFSVARNLAYSEEERQFLGDKNTVANAEFCHQCGECRADCPKQVEIPSLMRSHMYALQYRNVEKAQSMLASLPLDKGLTVCRSCVTCEASCRGTVNIPRKIAELKVLV